MRSPKILLALVLAAAGAGLSQAADWPAWRGPGQDGISPETGLIAGWSAAGENLIWHADLVGRSTPVVFDGRVCANGRTGEGVTKQEVVACWDAGTGKKLWERRLDVYHTAVPFNRVGWASLAFDPETGHLFAHGVGGLLICFDREGKAVWSRALTEELGFQSGFGGRTHTPLVDEDRLILSFVTVGWGEMAPPRHRTFAFDKRTGELLWVSTPGEAPFDLNTSSTPVVAVIGGQRLLIEPNADGWVYALKARTGEKVWGFQLSKSGLNNGVAVAGDRVFASHSEENLDVPAQGRVVAIDATGTGDVTKTKEVWRNDEFGVGFSTPLLHDGRLYVLDNSANLAALDVANGAVLWRHKLGTVGKSSAVWADGKLWLPEVNGNFHILKPGADKVEVLDSEHLTLPDGRYAEIYGSAAIAYGRVYFTAESGLYCLGDPKKPFRPEPSKRVELREEPAAAGAAPASIQIAPADVLIAPGETVRFRVHAFDARGRALGERPAEIALDGLAGKVATGAFTADPARGFQTGKVAAKLGELQAASRVRVAPPLPWSEDFEAIAPGGSPAGWIGAGGGKFVVKERDGGRTLAKPPVTRGVDRSDIYIGPPSLAGYTVQADLLGTRAGRRMPDIGLIDSGYTLDLMGGHQRLQVRSWNSELRLMKQVDFPWEPDVWYTMKLRVDVQGDRGLIRGKVWRRGEPEPAAWTITAEDPLPIRHGSPGLYGYSAAEIHYDNLKVTVNE